jgi:hypothetical protein
MEQAERRELIGVEDAERAAERFILGRHSDAEVRFEKAVLKALGPEPIYEVEGHFATRGRFLSSGRKKLFKIQVHAYSAKIVSYEM